MAISILRPMRIKISMPHCPDSSGHRLMGIRTLLLKRRRDGQAIFFKKEVNPYPGCQIRGPLHNKILICHSCTLPNTQDQNLATLESSPARTWRKTPLRMAWNGYTKRGAQKLRSIGPTNSKYARAAQHCHVSHRQLKTKYSAPHAYTTLRGLGKAAWHSQS